MVSINDKWYHLDVTFDNTLSCSNIRYDYFNISTEEVIKDHTIFPSTYAPRVRCVDEKDYYILSGKYFDSKTTVEDYIKRCIKQQKTIIQIRVADSISENTIKKIFYRALLSASSNVTYEQSINPIRNVYTWSIKYD